MNAKNIKTAQRLAKEFTKLASVVLATERTIEMRDGGTYKRIDPGKLTGALRRKSMDLTRALADMRRAR
jgi:hypothetical protein